MRLCPVQRGRVLPLPSRGRQAMTLVEVVVALAISGLTVAAIVSGYTMCVVGAEKSALSLSASAMASERLEQTRCAAWNTVSWPPVDQLVGSNFPPTMVVLDRAGSGPGATYATNYTTITQVSTNPPLRLVRVDCVWQFNRAVRCTNTIAMCRAPDQ